jgi:hypothetical protein
MNNNLDLFGQSNPECALRFPEIGTSVTSQPGYMQQIQIILMVSEYGMSDIHTFVGDWLVLVGFCWLVNRSIALLDDYSVV